MKRRITKALMATLPLAGVFALLSAMPADQVITREDGHVVVNTTTLGRNVKGYNDTTPLKIHIQNGKILKIDALKNLETPKYFAKVKQELLPKWNGKTVKQAGKMKVDGVTGATYSSEAVIKNVKLGLDYYKRNK